jgi:transcriptional regulator with XRE-family HTH domain
MELHRRHGLSQTEIGSRSGLSQASIYKLLAGIGKPRSRTYVKVINGFPEAWRDYLERHPAARNEVGRVLGISSAMGEARTRFERFVQSDFGLSELQDLPKGYRDRYRRRVEQMMDPVVTKLLAYRDRLLKQYLESQHE